MHILALDVGTSTVKSAVLDAATAAPAGPVHRVGYDLDHPTADAAEVRPGRLWDAVAAAARLAADGAPPVEGVGLSCLTPALVLLDAADEPLSPLWVHLDRRSRPQARAVWAEVGEEFLHTAGNRPLPGGISALCYRQQAADDPSLPGRVRSYLHANGWLGLRLTGERAFDPGNACFSGLFETLGGQDWSARWCDYFGIDRDWLPPVRCGSETLGGLRPAVAADWGVPAGVPVKIGPPDTSSAMLACGLKPGELLHVVGTTQVLAAVVERPTPDPRRLTRRLGVGPEFVYVTHNPVGGAALTWLHELCFRDVPADEFFDELVPEARKRPTRVELDPPFLGGDRLNIEPAFASFTGLSLAADRMDLLAAVLAGMVRGHRAAVEGLGDAAPKAGGRVVLTGGGADAVRQLVPEYARTPIEQLDEGSLRGVARLFRPA